MGFNPLPMFCALLLAFWGSAVKAQVFAADVATSEWVNSSDPVCSLSHKIPGFGRAVFVHNPAGAATFYIEQQGKVIFPASVVTIETLPPSWRSNLIPQRLGKTTSMTGTKPIVLDAAQFRGVLYQLAKGVNVVFSSQTQAGKSSAANAGVMRIVLEVKNFAGAYKNFQLCSGDLVAVSSEQAADSSKSDSSVDPRVNQTDLSRVSSYVKRDASLYGNKLNVRSSNPAVTTQTFAADIKTADWTTASSPFACSLTHTIPNFGKAVLSHKAGGSELFYLEPQGTIIFPIGDAHFDTAPPLWKGDIAAVRLGKITPVIGKQPVTLIADQLTQLLAQLTAGTNVMFVAQSSADKNENSTVMRVLVDAKNFAVAHKNYQQCVNDLIPYSFAQVSRTSINFPEKAEALSGAAKGELNKVARYVKADEKVLAVLVDAHSDNTGTPEERELISKQQAEMVSGYLVEQGVNADKMAVRWHADKFAIADNKSAAGRAQNRRVTVRLEDENLRKEQEAAAKKAAEKNEQKNSTKEDAEQNKSEKPVSTGSSSKDNSTQTTSQAASSSTVSIPGKITPEQINKMVEGLEMIKKKQ